MKKSFILTLFFVMATVLFARPSLAQWPTLDATSIGTLLKSFKEETDQARQGIQKTILEAQNLAATGAQSLTMIAEDAAAKAEKARKEMERIQKRAEWLKEKKEKWEEQVKKTQAQYEATQKFVNDTKAQAQGYIDQGKDLLNQGKDMYEDTADQAKSYVDQAQEAVDQAKSYTNQAQRNADQNTNNYQQNNQTSTPQTPINPNRSMPEFEEETFTEVSPEIGEFSEGAWNTEEGIELETENLTEETAEEETITEMPQEVGGVPLSETLQRRAFRQLPKTEIVPQKFEEETFTEISPENEEFSEEQVNVEEEQTLAVTNEQNKEENTQESEENIEKDTEKEETTEEKAPEEVEAMPLAETPEHRTFRKSPETPDEDTIEDSSSAAQTSAVERIYLREPMAFAQMGDYKTGTDEEGTFVFSDIIANKCGMGLEDLSSEKVQECVKIWVDAMNDPDATVANEAKEEYEKALHDHVAANATKALDGTAYAASFKKDVADKLREKSEATTSIRDETAFMAKIMQTNAELMMHLLETDSADLTYDSLKEVKLLTKDYYEDEEAEQ